jgi:hypothetical protein
MSSAVNGTYHDGQVKLDADVDWPNGARVRVVPQPQFATRQRSSALPDDYAWGLDEADYEDTPEFREKLIAQMDSFEPLELTPEEEAEWLAARHWIKDYTVAAVRKEMGLEP